MASEETSGFDYEESYIEQHWEGMHSLARSYWLNGIASNCANALLLGGFAMIGPDLPLLGCMLAFIFLSVLQPVLYTWQIVGVWRSAGREIKEGAGMIWPYTARAVILLGAIFAIYQLAAISGPQVRECMEVLRGDPSLPETRVTVLPSGQEMEFRGALRLGSARTFQAVLSAAPNVKTVYIDTIGGRIAEAQKIADLVRQRRLDTYVEHQCNSAGVIILLAGVNRTACSEASIGLHSGSFPGVAASVMNDGLVRSLKRVGANHEFISTATGTPASAMWFPKAAELLKANVLTAVVNTTNRPWGTAKLNAIAGGSIPKMMGEVPSYRALAKIDPERYASEVTKITMRMKEGASWSEAVLEINSLVRKTVMERRVLSSGRAKDLYLDFMIALVERNSDIAPRATLQMLLGDQDATAWIGTEVYKNLPRYPGNEEYAFVVAVLEDEPDEVPFDREQAEKALSAILVQVGTTEDLQLIASTKIPDRVEDQVRLCRLYLSLLSKMKSAPPETRSSMIRLFLGAS